MHIPQALSLDQNNVTLCFTTILMPATRAGFFKEQRHAKETQEETPEPMGKLQAKTEHMDIVLNGPRKASVREEIRAASSTT